MCTKSFVISFDKNEFYLKVDNTVINTSNTKTYCERNLFYKNKSELFVLFEGNYCSNKQLIDNIQLNSLDTLYNELKSEFLFIIYDKINNKIFVARDVLGKKKGYYLIKNSAIYISNDGMSLLNSISNRTIDNIYIFDYLNNYGSGYLESVHTPFTDIKRIAYGSFISFDTKSKALFSRQYFDPNKIKYLSKADESEVVSYLDHAINESILHNIVYQYNTVGTTVSGGIDSSILCYYLSRIPKLNVTYYTFKPKQIRTGYSEDEYIASVANEYGIKIKEIVVPSAMPTLFESIYNNLNIDNFEPGFMFSNRINETIINALKKDGCNNIVFGNNENLFSALCKEIIIRKEYTEQKYINKLKFIPIYISKKSYEYNLSDQYIGWNKVLKEINPLDIFSVKLYENYLEHYHETFWSKINNMSSQELKYHSIIRPGGNYLLKDVYSSYGINCILPFLDIHLLQYILSIPSYHSHGRIKHLLKRLNVLPNVIVNRPKIISSATDYYEYASNAAKKLINEDLMMEPLINVNRFREICNNIISGNMTTFDEPRKFNVLVGLENFIRTHKTQFDI